MEIVKVEGGRDIACWASLIEEGALAQAENLARLPFAIGHVALMPDAHQGYGMPIGGVLFADRAVVPYAVGVDIGCGVSLTATSVHADDLGPERLQAALDAIAAAIPVGNGPDGGHKRPETGIWTPAVFEEPDGSGSTVLYEAVERAEAQLGTLGGGNHFIELQRGTDGMVWMMLHSGSRSVGKKVCDHWHKAALELDRKWHSALPDTELAWLPWDTAEARGYFSDMRLAMAWAEQNRAAMRKAAEEAIASLVPGVGFTEVADVHHNYAAWEHHMGRDGIVHRKGAVRAREGEIVLIPGSMGTASYVGEGLGSVPAFESCQHGAGRARGRKATLRLETEEQFAASMAGVLLGGNAANARDESPFAYKDIEAVMADSGDLVLPVMRLTPLGVVKG